MQNPGKRQTWRGAGAAGLILLGVAGCGTLSGASKSHTVNPDQLAQAPQNVMAPVKAQQAAIDEATRGREDAVRSMEDAERHVRLAQTDVDAANAELKRTEAEAGLLHKQYEEAQKPAGKSGASSMSSSNLQDLAQRMGKADSDVRDAKARVEAEELKLDYIKSLSTFEKSKIGVAEKRIELEKAKLERARFEALKVSQPEVAQDQKLNPAEFDAVIADREADLATATADVAKARSEATAKYRTWVARGETLIPAGQERANVPPPPKG